MIRRLCQSLIEGRGDARIMIVSVLFVTIARSVLEFNLHNVAYATGVFNGLGEGCVFYTATYFVFAGIMQLLIPGQPSGIVRVVSLGLLLGTLPPILETLVPALSGKGYNYMFQWQFFFYDPSYQPLSETLMVWFSIVVAALFVGIVTTSVLRGIAAFFLGWLGLAWLGVILPSWLVGDLKASITGERAYITLAMLFTAFVILHASRLRAHWPCMRRMNHALPFGALALCGSALAGFDLWQSLGRAALILYLCFVLLIHNDFYDHTEDALAERSASSNSSDVVYSMLLATLTLVTLTRFAPMVAMAASGMLLLGFAYHHPAFRLKENFCLSYTIEGGWALCALCTGVSGPVLLAGKVSLLWPCLLVFGGGALLSMPKDWKDVASDRIAKIPTLYVQLANTPDEEQLLHRRLVIAVGLGMLLALVLIWRAYGFSPWLPGLVLAAIPVLLVLDRMPSRGKAVEVFLTLLGLWLSGASFFLRDVLAR